MVNVHTSAVNSKAFIYYYKKKKGDNMFCTVVIPIPRGGCPNSRNVIKPIIYEFFKKICYGNKEIRLMNLSLVNTRDNE